MTRVKVYSVLICLTLLCLTANVRADAVFTFDNTPIGTQTPFSITNNGLTAQFSSDGAFEVASQSEMQFAAPFNGNYLLDSPEADGSFLEIDFSAQVTGASMDFATDDPAESKSKTLYRRTSAAFHPRLNCSRSTTAPRSAAAVPLANIPADLIFHRAPLASVE